MTPCLAEIPGLKNLVDHYGKDQFNFVAIGTDSAEEIQSYISNHPWPFDHVANAGETIFTTFKHRWGYPTTFVVDEHGIIVGAFAGGFHDERAVEDVFQKISFCLKSN